MREAPIRPSMNHHDNDEDEDRSILEVASRSDPENIINQPDLANDVTGQVQPDSTQKTSGQAEPVDYIPIYWPQNPDILVFAPYPRERSGIYSAVPTSIDDFTSRLAPDYPDGFVQVVCMYL